MFVSPRKTKRKKGISSKPDNLHAGLRLLQHKLRQGAPSKNFRWLNCHRNYFKLHGLMARRSGGKKRLEFLHK
jgi:hypothetical protein